MPYSSSNAGMVTPRRRLSRSARVVESMGTENRFKAQQHTAQEVAAIPLQKLSHKFELLQGTSANEQVPMLP